MQGLLRKPAGTAGSNTEKLKDPFAKRPRRKGIGQPRPLDLKQRASIRGMVGEGEAAARTEGSRAAVLHG